MGMIVKLCLDLPGDSQFVRVARLISRTLLDHLQVTPEPVDEIEFVVGELCTNVIRHAQSHDGRFTVELEYYAEKVIITVEDKGVGFEFRDVPEIGAERPDFGGRVRVGGFGFGLVRAFSDRLDFYRTDPNGTTVRAEKILSYRTEAARSEAESLETLGGLRGLEIKSAD